VQSCTGGRATGTAVLRFGARSKVEHVFEGVGEPVAKSQVKVSRRGEVIGLIVVVGVGRRAGDGQEALFDEREEGSVIADGV
jgi:hypothetical protein